MNTKHGILLMSIGLLLVCAFVGTASGKIWYVDDDGGADFTKIQDVIDVANESDTIFVYNGTYIEHLSIDKVNLTILGENRNTTIIDGHGYEGDVVTMRYANCTINGFTIENSGTSNAGINVDGTYNIVSNNIIKNNYRGIYLKSHNIIKQNIIADNNGDGIRIVSSNEYNRISQNKILKNGQYGICFGHNSANNIITDNNVSYNEYRNLYLYYSKNNTISGNTIKQGNGGIELFYDCYYNTIINNTIYNGGIHITSSNHNNLIANTLNHGAIRLERANYNLIRDNSNNYSSISIDSSNNNLIYHNNLISSGASDYNGNNKWDNGSTEGGNYWSNHNCTGNPSNGSEPYIIDGDSIDHYPFEDLNGWIQVENFIFDSGYGTYKSIMGMPNGTITSNQTITVNKLYTYPCTGTGGHTEYATIWNETIGECAIAEWDGYIDDYHNISFNKTLTLEKGVIYNYTIRTGSYLQIHHTDALPTTNGWINCTDFTDANGKKYDDWIPAIKLE